VNHESKQLEQSPVIFYDGKCVLCSWTIKFILKFDKSQKFFFSDFQSQCAREFGVYSLEPETVIVWYQHRVYYKSNGILKIGQLLGGAWKVLVVFKIIPLFIRDYCYDLIAKYRYYVFGKYEQCPLPSPEFRSRFLA